MGNKSLTMLYSHNTTIRIHIYNTNISGNIVNNNDDFSERTNTLLYKNISHTLYSRKGWCWLCVRGELDSGTDCYILTQVLLIIEAFLSHFGWGCSTVGSLRAQSPLSVAGSHFGILSPTDSNWLEPPRAPGDIIVSRSPASAVLPLIYAGTSLDWWLGRGSIYNNHPILIFRNSTCGIFLHVRLHPPHTHILQIMLKDNNSKKNTKRNYLNHSKNTKRN